MGQGQGNAHIFKQQTLEKSHSKDDFVLEKAIFSNVFEKDIRKVFIYKKAERLAKAIYLIAPAFTNSVSLKNRIDAIGIGLVDAAVISSSAARIALARELLLLSSTLSIARASNLLSVMNAELISREAQALLHEVAAYEEPRLSFEDTPTLSSIARETLSRTPSQVHELKKEKVQTDNRHPQIKDIKDTPNAQIKDRREAILSVISKKGNASIKDITVLVRGVSEKTIQRELSALIRSGEVTKQGERRWSTYSLPGR